MLRALVHFSRGAAKEAHHWEPMNRHCGSEIYQKWYSAVNEKAAASPLPIHHRWCIADKLLGSNKPSLRGWPHWWKQKLPHGHPGAHTAPSLPYNSQCLSLYKGTHINTITSRGWCVPRVHWQKRTNTQFVFRLWGCASPPPLLDAGAGRRSQRGYSHSTGLTCVFTRLFKQHLVFHFAWTLTNRPGRVHVLEGGEVWCKYLLVTHSIVYISFTSPYFIIFVSADETLKEKNLVHGHL